MVNEVEYTYDGWGNLAEEWQEHDGAVDTQSTLSVEYTYDDGASGGIAKYVRLAEVTYPNGREINYDYGTAGAIDDIMSRLSSIFDDADDDGTIDTGEDVYAAYDYLGAGRIVTEDYAEAEVKLDYTANDFAALDRFGRVLDQVWTDYGADPDAELDHFGYTYDRAGNRTERDNDLHTSFNEDYTYDNLDRLTDTDRADAFDQSWTLDGLGNFAEFDNDGTTQDHTANAANELTAVNGWTSPAHDAAGNMTTIPTPSGSLGAKYDGWNRLIEVTDGTDPLAEFAYDGTGRRIVQWTDFVDDEPQAATHYFHDDQQVIETRQGSPATAPESLDEQYQNIWSPRYIDSLILRDEYSSGVLQTASRLYYLSDANYNVTALVGKVTNVWQVVERYVYTPYGKATVLDPNFATDGDGVSDYTNTTLYTGRALDAATGLYYYRARYYSADLGRFVSRDPFGYFLPDEANNDQSGTRPIAPAIGNSRERLNSLESASNGNSVGDEVIDFNLYRYVCNNPTDSCDPTGTDRWVFHGDWMPMGASNLPVVGWVAHWYIIVDVWDRTGTKVTGAARLDWGPCGYLVTPNVPSPRRHSDEYGVLQGEWESNAAQDKALLDFWQKKDQEDFERGYVLGWFRGIRNCAGYAVGGNCMTYALWYADYGGAAGPAELNTDMLDYGID